MIYFVDEDTNYISEFSIPLIMRGHNVTVLSNADEAAERLSTADDVELVVVDVMLATGSAEKSVFGADETEGFLQTGLALMHHLVAKRPDIFPGRFVVLTAATEFTLVRNIDSVCDKLGVTKLNKGDFRRPAILADKLIELMR